MNQRDQSKYENLTVHSITGSGVPLATQGNRTVVPTSTWTARGIWTICGEPEMNIQLFLEDVDQDSRLGHVQSAALGVGRHHQATELPAFLWSYSYSNCARRVRVAPTRFFATHS